MDLTTERLVLRTLRAGDAPWLAAEIARPDVHRWLTSPPRPYGLSDAEGWIATVAQDPHVRLITHAGAPLGIVSLSLRDHEPDLGYWLKEAAWDQGFMTEAAHGLLSFHFARGAGPVGSGWIAGNTASEGVLRKLGFTDAGTRTDYSHFHGRDVVLRRVRLESAQGLQAPARRATRA